MKTLLLLTVILAAGAGKVWADVGAVFTSISGKVRVQAAGVTNLSPAQMGTTVTEGARIVTGTKGQATLQAFDGSQIEISPKTDFTVTKLQQPSPKDKVIQFKLALGKILAHVNKLLTAKSSFEIEAGGVVCGVRGTDYYVSFDPATGQVNVQVIDGTVWAAVNGQTQTFQGGQGGTYQNGNWTPSTLPSNSTSNSNNSNSTNSNSNTTSTTSSSTSPADNPSSTTSSAPTTPSQPNTGFISSNPFYGFNGTGTDEFNTPLSNIPSSLPGVTGQIGSSGTAQLGAQTILTLQLGFPQYNPLAVK